MFTISAASDNTYVDMQIITSIYTNVDYAWGHQSMVMLSALLGFCEIDTAVTGGFPSQRVSNEDLWFHIGCMTVQAVEQTLIRSLVWPSVQNFGVNNIFSEIVREWTEWVAGEGGWVLR